LVTVFPSIHPPNDRYEAILSQQNLFPGELNYQSCIRPDMQASLVSRIIATRRMHVIIQRSFMYGHGKILFH
jgi:hypothetical protein